MSNSTSSSTIRFEPVNVGRWIIWSLFALLLALMPLAMPSSFGLTLLCLIGINAIACLSYNMLLGQTGLLSFGHAVYVGLGAFISIHAMNKIAGGWMIPMSLIPLIGGLAGLFFGALFGYVTTRKAGTTFAMITMGIGELVFASALMFPEFFGGESGINANRTAGVSWFGITFGPQIQVYYLIAAWFFLCTAAMFAFTHTPLGRVANAVRDNPERAEFVGYDAQRVRYIVMMISTFFAGVAGGLTAVNFEAITAENVSAIRSGGYLLFVFLGGAIFFIGPILGAVLLVFALVVLSEWTQAWQLYVGVTFLIMVMYAPGGLSALIMMNLRLAKYGLLRPILGAYIALGATLFGVLIALSAVVEMVYQKQLDVGGTKLPSVLGIPLDFASANTWMGIAMVFGVSLFLFELCRREFSAQWADAQVQIEAIVRREEQA